MKEKDPKGETDPCSVLVRKIKQQQLDRVADRVGGIQQQCREQFKSPGMLPNILYDIREQKHGQDYKNIRDCREMAADVRLRRKCTLSPLRRERSGKALPRMKCAKLDWKSHCTTTNY